MRYDSVTIEKDFTYILPISDIHIGDKNFTKKSEELLKSNLEWAKKEHAYIFLNGDILNVATRRSASSPSDQVMNLQQQIEYAIELFKPYKDNILGAIDGNHEQRLMDDTGYSPLSSVCGIIGIKYYATSVVLKFTVGMGRATGKNVAGKVSYCG